MTTFTLILSLGLTVVALSAGPVSCDPVGRDQLVSLMSMTLTQGLREDPDIKRDARELITSKGFPCENHYVTTEDGYILGVFRIPHGRSQNSTGPKPVVILQHGLLGSCTNYLTNLVNESLAYILADAGADVWLTNSRGNYYSYNHTRLSPKSKEFWEFSFDDMGRYDVPAVINYVTGMTGAEQVFYVGHSQGTTIGFIGFGENPQVAAKVKTFIALAPVARVGNTESPIKFLAPFAKEISVFLDLFGPGEIHIDPAIMRLMAGTLCSKWGEELCANFLFLICGFDKNSLNMTRVPVYVAHNPSSTSVRDVLHWAQGVNSKQFQAFDYGSAAENMKHYNQSTPPLFDPKKVKIPVAIFRGGQDWLADPTDVSWLLPQLNVVLDVNIERYEHLDFIWAIDAPTVIYKQLLQLIFS